jgi:hypothetical protein
MSEKEKVALKKALLGLLNAADDDENHRTAKVVGVLLRCPRPDCAATLRASSRTHKSFGALNGQQLRCVRCQRSFRVTF